MSYTGGSAIYYITDSLEDNYVLGGGVRGEAREKIRARGAIEKKIKQALCLV